MSMKQAFSTHRMKNIEASNQGESNLVSPQEVNQNNQQPVDANNVHRTPSQNSVSAILLLEQKRAVDRSGA